MPSKVWSCVFGALGLIVSLVSKITNGENLEPGFRLQLWVMGKLKWTDEFLAEVARDLFNCHGGMADDIVSGLKADLFFCDICPGYAKDSMACVFGRTILSWLLLGWGSNNVALVGKNQFKGFTTNECQNQVWMSFALVSKTMASKCVVKVKRIKGNIHITRSWCSSGSDGW